MNFKMFKGALESFYTAFLMMALKWLCIINTDIKETVHPKMKILSSFTHPQVDPNLYECVCSAEHKERYSEE